jgi:hypothetical protein
MFDKIMDNVYWVFFALVIVLLAGTFYNLGSHNARNKICNDIGGTYVKTYEGDKCLHAVEITL